MIKITDYKEKYAPIKQGEDGAYYVCWNYKDVVDIEYKRDEKGNLILDKNNELIPTGNTLETPLATWWVEMFVNKPSQEYIENMIIGWCNKQIDRKILTGFVWNNYNVWLSQENQFNYKAAYDLAVQTGGKSLPIIFKFNTADSVTYKQFNTLEELTDFYTKAMKFINDVLNEGWKMKDAIDFSVYNVE